MSLVSNIVIERVGLIGLVYREEIWAVVLIAADIKKLGQGFGSLTLSFTKTVEWWLIPIVLARTSMLGEASQAAIHCFL